MGDRVRQRPQPCHGVVPGRASGRGRCPAAYNQAQAWLAGLGGAPADYVIVLLASTTDPQHQNFITDFSIPQLQRNLPEPSSLPLAAIGMAALLMLMRRRAHN